MKITFVSPEVSQGGGSRVIANHAIGLRDLGHEVTVVSRLPVKKSLLRHWTDELRGRETWRDPHYARFFDPLGDRHVQIEQPLPLRPDQLPDADILIATWWRTAFDVASMPPEKGEKVYFVQGHETFDEFQAPLAAGSYFLPLRKIVISTWLENIMAETYGDRNCLKVVNAIDLRKFNAPPRRKNRVPTVGVIYSRFGLKGFKTAFEAIGLLRKRLPDLRVIAFGSDSLSSSLPLPSGTAYTKLPPQTEIPGFYAACDAWIAPSRNEGFGLPILEAMACRTPVVATRAGAAEDLIDDAVSGYVVDIDDAKTMADRLGKILSLSPEDWKAMSDVAYRRATSRTWSDATAEFEAALKAIGAQGR